jgi:hypothetical protein
MCHDQKAPKISTPQREVIMQALRKLFGRTTHSTPRRPQSVRLGVEQLDERLVPANVSSLNGPIIPNVMVEPIFYGSSWSTNAALKQQANDIMTFMGTLANSSYMDELGQYYQSNWWGPTFVGHGATRAADITGDGPTSGTIYDNPDTPGASLSAFTAQDLIRREILKGNVDSPNANTLYMVYLAPGVQFFQSGTINSTNDYGYHWTSSANDGFFSGATWIPSFNYALVAPLATPDNGQLKAFAPFQKITSVSSHELAESVTDPDASTGWKDRSGGPTNGQEIGDLAGNEVGNLMGYAVQYEWSNQDNGPALWQPSGAHWVFDSATPSLGSFGASAAEQAWYLRHTLGLYPQGNNMWLNWGGKNEKWFWAKDGTQYFITPDGTVYQYDNSGTANGTPVAWLNGTYWANTTLISNATAPSTLHNLEKSLGLTPQGNNMQLNLYGMNEKWFWGNNGTQYYILPNGQLYLWYSYGYGNIPILVANLNSYYWTDPSLLTSA